MSKTVAQRGTNLDSLPQELFDHIINYLDIDALWERLRDQPLWKVAVPSTATSSGDLKALSCTSKTLRWLLFPHLFRHVRLLVDQESRTIEKDCSINPYQSLVDRLHDCMRFFSVNNRGLAVRSFSIAIHNDMSNSPRISDFFSKAFANPVTYTRWICPLQQTCPNLESFVMIASPRWVGLLLGIEVSAELETELFIPYHVLAMECSSRKTRGKVTTDMCEATSILFSHPWTALFLGDQSHMYSYGGSYLAGTNEFLSGSSPENQFPFPSKLAEKLQSLMDRSSSYNGPRNGIGLPLWQLREEFLVMDINVNQ